MKTKQTQRGRQCSQGKPFTLNTELYSKGPFRKTRMDTNKCSYEKSMVTTIFTFRYSMSSYGYKVPDAARLDCPQRKAAERVCYDGRFGHSLIFGSDVGLHMESYCFLSTSSNCFTV